MTRPVPLTDADADLTAFKDMPLEIARFVGSNLVSDEDPEVVLAALMLWCASWHQRPAGSLSKGDKYLAKAAGYGRVLDAWLAVKERVLRGWIECSDGRLYHPVVAEKVRGAWTSRLKQMHRTYGSAIRMHNTRHPNDKRDALTFDEWLDAGRPEGVKRDGPRAAEQADLPLSGEENAECDAQQDASLRATGGDVARLNGPKGREGKGREGKGDIDTIDVEGDESAALDVDDERMDLLGRTNRLARLGGVSLHQERNRVAAMDLVKAWEADGIDLATAEEAIPQWLEKCGEQSIGSLKFYDGAVRKAHALQVKRGKAVDPETHKAWTPEKQREYLARIERLNGGAQ
jgi:hypothetical protein